MTDTYEGWKNWETWNVMLWLNNEEPLYRAKQAFLRRGKLDVPSVRRFCEETFPRGTSDMRSDHRETVAEQWAKVDWSELAEHFATEAIEDAKYR
jgi:hypothetical protein